jgi:hypothetical protein
MEFQVAGTIFLSLSLLFLLMVQHLDNKIGTLNRRLVNIATSLRLADRHRDRSVTSRNTLSIISYDRRIPETDKVFQELLRNIETADDSIFNVLKNALGANSYFKKSFYKTLDGNPRMILAGEMKKRVIVKYKKLLIRKNNTVKLKGWFFLIAITFEIFGLVLLHGDKIF